MFIISNSIKIYCDLDGVLVDFKKGFLELTGGIDDLQKTGVEFLNIFHEHLRQKSVCEVEFWSNLDWMEDGRELWDFIKIYQPEIITAPTYDPSHSEEKRYCIHHNKCMQGKTKWVDRLDFVSNLNFREPMKKSEFAASGKILIDDRLDIIQSWRDKNGIGIHHINSEKTINELQAIFKSFKHVGN